MRAAEVLDGVAAVVNGDVITFSQVREVVSARERALRAQFSGQDLVNKIKEARMGALKDLNRPAAHSAGISEEGFQRADPHHRRARAAGHPRGFRR